MFDIDLQQSQLMLLAGIILLGWTLIRRQIKTNRRRWEEDRQHRLSLRQTAAQSQHAVPLADAPVETLRWQAEMFDLQRELKAELDAKICVIQSLLREVDARLAKLGAAATAHAAPLSADQLDQAQRWQRQGLGPNEIAAKLRVPVGDVELALPMVKR